MTAQADLLIAAGIKVHVIYGADVAAELDAKRAIAQGTQTGQQVCFHKPDTAKPLFLMTAASGSRKESAPRVQRIDMGSRGVSQISYLASLRGEGHHH